MIKRLLATFARGSRSSSKVTGQPALQLQAAGKPNVLPTADFRAVSLVPRVPICWAAEQQIGKRLLLRKNPRLPLSDCSMPHQCTCKFAMHADRRQGERRSTSVRWGSVANETGERRQARGRRSTDK